MIDIHGWRACISTVSSITFVIVIVIIIHIHHHQLHGRFDWSNNDHFFSFGLFNRRLNDDFLLTAPEWLWQRPRFLFSCGTGTKQLGAPRRLYLLIRIAVHNSGRRNVAGEGFNCVKFGLNLFQLLFLELQPDTLDGCCPMQTFKIDTKVRHRSIRPSFLKNTV